MNFKIKLKPCIVWFSLYGEVVVMVKEEFQKGCSYYETEEASIAVFPYEERSLIYCNVMET